MRSIIPERYIDLVSGSTKHIPQPQYNAWERNVRDEYKGLSNDEIRTKVEQKRLPYAILMTHINIDYNLAGVLRVGNCLGAKVFYYGHKKWDKRASCGCYHYTPINYLPSLEAVVELKGEYSFVALEQHERSIPMHKFDWKTDKKPLIVVGEEARGLQGTPEIFDLVDCVVEIGQFGSIRSMNATTSVGIAAYDLMTKRGYFDH